MARSKLLEKVVKDTREAVKSRDRGKASILRLLQAEVHNEEIARRKKGEFTNGEVEEVIFRMLGKHRDSIEAFRKGGREDLVAKEEAELRILQGYLPPPLTREEIETVVGEAIETTGAKALSDLGRVMGEVMPKVKGRAEGNLVKEIVKEKLGRT